MSNLVKGLGVVAVIASVGLGYYFLEAGFSQPVAKYGNESKEGAKEKSIVYVEGEHYVSIDPVYGLPENSVVEIFWYGCPHCHKMEDVISSPEFIEKSKGWNFQQYHLAKKDGVVGFDFRVFSALVQMGLHKTVGKEYMKALHEDGLDRSKLAEFAKKHGLPMETLSVLSENDEAQSYYSFISQFSSREEFKGVPSFVVQGRYIVNNKYNIPDVINYLLNKDAESTLSESSEI